MNVLVLGSTGITGCLLLQLLHQHPKITTITAVSTSHANESIDTSSLLINSEHSKFTHSHYVAIDDVAKTTIEYDAIFSALPHGVSAPAYHTLLSLYQQSSSSTMPVFIDLSADFRYRDASTYQQTYKPTHEIFSSKSHMRASHKAVYGLSELQRNELANADIIACPGCYPTSILLPLLPILRYCTPTHPITITSTSGISGAGIQPRHDNLFVSRAESLMPYHPGTKHTHYAEISYQMQAVAHANHEFFFTPQLAPLSQGMLSCIHIPLAHNDIDRAEEALQAQYRDEYFISVFSSEQDIRIDTKKVRNTNHAHIQLHKESNMLLVFCVIDNLWKGAVGQAIQNCNIRFDFPEYTGLQGLAT